MDRLKDIIQNRTVCILNHGKSIEKLENYITELKDKNICWASLGLFPVMEEFILSKINKQLDIVFDCATVAESFLRNYELHIRIPRIDRFLSRNYNNIWITSFGIVRDTIKGLKLIDFWIKHNSKTFIVDNIFPKNRIGCYMDVPNSITLLIASLLYGNAKRIIIFGLDGYKSSENNINSYYKPELHQKEHLLATGNIGNTGLVRDTIDFETRFSNILNMYRSLFKNNASIYNCSNNTIYTCIEKINIEQLKDLI